jgi:hypothetical protein
VSIVTTQEERLVNAASGEALSRRNQPIPWRVVSDMPSYPTDGYSYQQRSGTPPLEVGEVIDRGFRMWRRTLAETLPWVLPIAAIGPVVGYLVGGQDDLQQWTEQFQREVERNPEATPNFDGLGNALQGTLVPTLVTAIIGLVISGALTAFYADRIVMRQTKVAECMVTGFKRLGPLVLVALVSGFISLLGCFVFCVGLFFFATRFSVAPQVCIVERAGVGTSLRRSWSLTERRFWPMLGLILLSYIFAALISLPFSLLAQIAGEGTGRDIAQIVAGTVSGGLGASLTASLLVFAYLDLRVRFENLDLGLVAAQHNPEPNVT